MSQKICKDDIRKELKQRYRNLNHDILDRVLDIFCFSIAEASKNNIKTELRNFGNFVPHTIGERFTINPASGKKELQRESKYIIFKDSKTNDKNTK